MASSSLSSRPSPDVPTKTVVKFSNSCGDDVHPEAAKLVLHGGESRLGCGQLCHGDHDADVLLEHVPVAGDGGKEERVVIR